MKCCFCDFLIIFREFWKIDIKNTGNDCVDQAQKFNESIEIDGIILSKADVDDKGGAAVSVGYVTKKPILYIGTGQEYDDLKEFTPDIVLEHLGL